MAIFKEFNTPPNTLIQQTPLESCKVQATSYRAVKTRVAMTCTVPEVFGSVHGEQKCESCSQRASIQRARGMLPERARKSCYWSDERLITVSLALRGSRHAGTISRCITCCRL